jgi:hypothetical protein
MELVFIFPKCVLYDFAYFTILSLVRGSRGMAPRLGGFTPEEKAPGIRWKGGWVDPRERLDVAVKRKKIPSHYTD